MATKEDVILENQENNPKDTPYLLSHQKEEEEFFTAFKSGHLHHSWLITGTKGIGKATLAYRIARYIFSLNNPNHLKNLNINIDTSSPILDNLPENNFNYDDEDEDESEDSFSSLNYTETPIQSPSVASVSLDKFDTSPLKLSASHPIFERLKAGGLTDLIIIEREFSDASKTKLKTEISVEQIRKLKEFFSKTSSEGGYKIAIIDSVDEMNTNSKNALLKILEEAPNQSLLLLICHNINGLLPTIKSRCRILKLSPIDDKNMELLLKDKIPSIKENEIKELIKISEGSIGTALNIYKNNGLDLQTKFLGVIPEIFNKKNSGILEIINTVGNSEEIFNIFQDIVIRFLSNAIKYKSKLPIKNLTDIETRALDVITTYYKNIKSLFSIREAVLKDFRLVPLLNLDITATIISTFERIKNVN